MKKLLLYSFLLFFHVNFGQSRIDSLNLKLQTSSIDSVKIKTLHLLFDEYQYEDIDKAGETLLKSIELSKEHNHSKLLIKGYDIYGKFLISQSDYDSAIVVFNKNLKLSEKLRLNNYQIQSLVGLSSCYLRKGDFKKSLTLKKQTIELAKKTNDDESIAASYKSMGDLYLELAEYTNAMTYYTLASDSFEKLNNEKGLSISLANIGIVQWKMENYESAKAYFIRSDSIFKKIDFQPGRAFVLQNLGIVYKNLGEIDTALTYYERAMDSYSKMGDLHNVGIVNYNIGNIYWEKNDLNKALEYYQKSLSLHQSTQDSLQMTYSVKAIGDAYHGLNNNAKSEEYLLKAVNLTQAIHLDIVEMQTYQSLADVYEEEGDYTKAFNSLKRYNNLKDSLYTKEKRELARDIEAKYQNQQKAKEIEFLAKDNDLQALKLSQRINERNVIIAFAFILLLLGFLIYNQYRIKQKANIKLQELDKLKSNFFTNISHEFRTPLTLIKGPIEQLEQNPDEHLSHENVKMIRRNANRLLKLVNQLLDLSRVDEGSLKLEPTEGDVFKCLRAATSSFNSYAAQHHIDYKVNIPQSSFWASFDREKLETIIYNLLSNAFKFSDDGSYISCDVVYNSHGLSIQVADSGKGIPEDKIIHIFDRFYQVDSSHTKEKEGSGVGLSLTKSLVELMDGTITVSSEVNKGSFFSVQLPIQSIKTGVVNSVQVVTTQNEHILQPNTFLHTKPDTRQLPEILVVEDNEDMRHFIKESLFTSYRITEAVNGELGLKQATDHPPDLIISDVMMPKMDGFELCEQLKTNVITSHIPVIILTAKAGMKNKIEGLETGADDYLTKPFDVNELKARVKNLIAQRENLRQLYAKSDLKIDPKQITVTSVDQKFVQQVITLLEENYFEPDFGIQQMQEQLAMSKTQLHRKLKALTNEAPGELLRNFRLKRAAQLLSQDVDNVTQVAYQVGFNNLSYFAKCFKELYGVAPSSYSST